MHFWRHSTRILLVLFSHGVAKQLSLLSYVRAPNLAQSKDSKTAAGESTVVVLDNDKEDVNESCDNCHSWKNLFSVI